MSMSTSDSIEVPVEGLHKFVRLHLATINGVVAASVTTVGVLDFLAPTLSLLPKMVYSATALLVCVMLISAIAPALAIRLISAAGLGARLPSSGPLWRRPAWQIAMAMLLGVTILGFVSVAKASQGGLIASSVPAARSFQESLLGLRQGVADIGRGVDAANGKLDTLVADARDPQRELVSRGYSIDGSGLMRAFKQDDKKAVALFVAVGYRVDWEGPLAVLLNGAQPWDGDLVAMLPRAMFGNAKACDTQGYILVDEGAPPVSERIAAFKRLCDTATVINGIERAIKQDAGVAPLNESQRRRQESRVANLALLRQ